MIAISIDFPTIETETNQKISVSIYIHSSEQHKQNTDSRNRFCALHILIWKWGGGEWWTITNKMFWKNLLTEWCWTLNIHMHNNHSISTSFIVHRSFYRLSIWIFLNLEPSISCLGFHCYPDCSLFTCKFHQTRKSFIESRDVTLYVFRT